MFHCIKVYIYMLVCVVCMCVCVVCVCLLLCLYCAVLVCEIRWLMPPVLLFLLKFALALWGLLSLYMDFRIFSYFYKNLGF